MHDMAPEFLDVDGRRIAILARSGAAPGIVWLGGFRSEMTATKASHLDRWAERAGRAFTRFDYAGHGASPGDFLTLTLSTWLDDALAVIRRRTTGPQILVGSSMGGWIALLAIRALRLAGEAGRVTGLVLVAPAPDFTERLMWAQFPDAVRAQIEKEGLWLRPSPYSPEPYPITKALIEDGRRHLILTSGVEVTCPVHILHGTADPDVPWQMSVELMARITGAHVALTLVKDGDHRLSTASDLALLERAVADIAAASA